MNFFDTVGTEGNAEFTEPTVLGFGNFVTSVHPSVPSVTKSDLN